MSDAPHDPNQPRLFAFAMEERSAATLVVGPSNQLASELCARWRSWPGGTAIISGPPSSGRSHVAHAWAQTAHAGVFEPRTETVGAAFSAHAGRLLVDDADRTLDEDALIRLFDLARYEQGTVLLVVAPPPSLWAVKTPDLRSRILAAPTARLEDPDESLLNVVLRRLCRDRYMELSPEAAHYLVNRMERSFAAARGIVEVLDRQVIQGARPISVVAARKALEDWYALRGDDPSQEIDAAS
jgi:chromosomal replication initiation ATPase DnaA